MQEEEQDDFSNISTVASSSLSPLPRSTLLPSAILEQELSSIHLSYLSSCPAAALLLTPPAESLYNEVLAFLLRIHVAKRCLVSTIVGRRGYHSRFASQILAFPKLNLLINFIFFITYDPFLIYLSISIYPSNICLFPQRGALSCPRYVEAPHAVLCKQCCRLHFEKGIFIIIIIITIISIIIVNIIIIVLLLLLLHFIIIIIIITDLYCLFVFLFTLILKTHFSITKEIFFSPQLLSSLLLGDRVIALLLFFILFRCMLHGLVWNLQLLERCTLDR